MRKPLIKIILFSAALSMWATAAVPISEPSLPSYAVIDGVPANKQTLPLSCESRSAADLAGYWGISVNEVKFFNALPTSDNPEKGFVGNVYGAWGQTPPNPYGVHAQPIAKNLRKYGLEAKAKSGMSLNALKKELANGRPVIVWVIGHVWKGSPITYTAKDGSKVIVAKYEHTMLAYGYDDSNIYLIDAGNGSKGKYSISNFKASWGVLGNIAVIAQGEQSKAPTEEPASDNNSSSGSSSTGKTYTVKPGDFLSKLAQEWGISWQGLAALNNIVYPYIIYPGQVLKTGVGNADKTPTKTAKPTKTQEPTPKPTKKVSKKSQGNYTVKRGDHLMQIARDLELNWKAIAELNNLQYPYTLYPGQVLNLPGTDAGSSPAPVPEENETQSDKEKEDTKDSSENTYTVKKGDWLYALAREFGVSWQTLASLNKITYPYIIHPGQVLTLPD
ncbi:MAG: LysM peptidoglycan-binding domain-containing protein [Anaerolineales bacterium]